MPTQFFPYFISFFHAFYYTFENFIFPGFPGVPSTFPGRVGTLCKNVTSTERQKLRVNKPLAELPGTSSFVSQAAIRIRNTDVQLH